MLFEQIGDRERLEGRHQRHALFEHVVAVLDGTHDGRVGCWPTNLEIDHCFDQGRLGKSGRRLCAVARGSQVRDTEGVASCDVWKPNFAVFEIAVWIV